MPPVLGAKAAKSSDLGAGYLGLGQGQGTGCLFEDRLFDSAESAAAVKLLSASAWGLALHRVGATHPIAHLDSRGPRLIILSYVDPAFCSLQNLFAVGFHGDASMQGPTFRNSLFSCSAVNYLEKAREFLSKELAFPFCPRPCEFCRQSPSYVPLTTVLAGGHKHTHCR